MAIRPSGGAAGTGALSHGSILALGVEINRVRACLLEEVSGVYRLAAWHSLARTRDTNLATLSVELCLQLGTRIGRQLVDAPGLAPFQADNDAVHSPPIEQVAVVASPSPQLRVWIAGLSLGQSMAATYEALCSSPAHLIGHTVLSPAIQVTALAESLVTAAPDLLVIAGGFDDPSPATHHALVELSRLLGRALYRLAPAQRPAVVYAGNRWAAPHAAEAVQSAGGGPVEAVANVQPAPALLQKTALAQACSFHYERLCRRTPGFRELSRWVTPPGHMLSQESSFTQLVRLWMELHELPALHGLYCAPLWWLHVWTTRGEPGAQIRFVEPQTCPPDTQKWPPLQLVSGEWPLTLWPQPDLFWWDRSGMVPLVAAVGQSAPQAMLETLHSDLLRPYRPPPPQ